MIKKYYSKSWKWIIGGFAILIGSYIAEETLGIVEGHPLYEIDSLIFLAGLVLVWGGFYFYVKSKGRHWAWTLTLVTGLIGIIIMAALSDKSGEVKGEKGEIEHIEKGGKKVKHIAVSPIFWGILIGLGLAYLLFTDYEENGGGFFANKTLKEKVQGAIVNIYCPYADEEFTLDALGTGGSGTVYESSGVIFTNEHIYPQTETDYLVHEQGCFIVFPDPKTGQPDEVYVATPYIVPDLGLIYDLAYLEIYDAYTDESGISYGEYPREFPSVEDLPMCYMADLELGDPVLVLGYPSLTGGLNLTLTEGIISSFDPTGTIITSAQITEGNSGGLALSENSCIIGVPSLYLFEERHEIGGIISVDSMMEFSELASDPNYREKIESYIDELLTGIELTQPEGTCGRNTYYVESENTCYCEEGYDWEDWNDENNLNCVEITIEPAFVSIPDIDTLTRSSNNAYYIYGSTSNNCSRIVAKAVNATSGRYDEYQLKNYNYGDTSFRYGIREDFNNLYPGDNTYTFTAYCDGEQVKEVSTTLTYY